jgi:hypothetical protein
MLPRPMTTAEMNMARPLFPQMMFQRVVVTDEPTDVYNCLAYTVCAATWVWPWRPVTRKVSKQEFDDLYRRYGYKPSGFHPTIGVAGKDATDMLHGYRHLLSGNAMGESKLGQWLRVRHGLDDIVGGFYGWHMGDYAPAQLGEAEPMTPSPNVPLDLLQAVQTETAGVPQALRDSFERAYAVWQKTWSDPAIALSSSPGPRVGTQEFRDLVALGTPILPLLMERALQQEHWSAVLAIDELTGRTDEALDLDDPKVLEGEQGRAIDTVRRWLESGS